MRLFAFFRTADQKYKIRHALVQRIPHATASPGRGGRLVRALASCLLGLAALSLPHGGPALAYEARLMPAPSGKPLFELRFFNQGERYDEPDQESAPVSTWRLGAAQKNAVARAVALWAEVLGPGSANSAPLAVHVGTYDDKNADAVSAPNEDAVGKAGFTGVAGGIILNQPLQSLAQIRVGRLDFGISGQPSSLPLTGKFDFVATLYHEMGHALGITSWASDSGSQYLSCWDRHLRDKYGTRLAEGMTIVEGSGGRPGTDFIVGRFAPSGVTFHGAHVSQALDGALDDGLPVNGFEGGSAEFSHIELERSLMSHQSYRNYTTFMEAELAALQDIGYSIDRRNFFGSSVYGDDLTLINRNGYFARNAAGTAYLPGQANTATLGVGLHIYGKRNDVTQAADLLAGGPGGTGVRVDGSGNTLRIEPGVRVAADGDWGTGLLVAYGKDQTVVSRGEVQALGRGGVAARFDFGDNAMGNDDEYRGSWIRKVKGIDETITGGADDDNGFELNLDGPLVERFEISGRLAGSAAAIYISENAWVKNISFMSGAEVTGSIISDWDPDNADIQYTGPGTDLHTALTFGLKDAGRGRATATPDAAFSMTLRGGIYGGESLDMQLLAGRLNVLGPVNVYALKNEGHLALYSLNANGRGATVTTEFINAADATLETGFTADGRVTGVTADTASVKGAWALTPLRDFYPSDVAVRPASAVQRTDGTPVTGFTSVTLGQRVSPTLNFSLLSTDPGTPLLGVRRAADAYSRYADTAGAGSVGRAMPGVASKARGDMRALLTALDFSAPDGSGVRQGLSQLGPEAYDAAGRAALAQQGEFNILLLRRMLGNESRRRLDSRRTARAAQETGATAALAGRSAAAGDAPLSGPQAWITPFGSSAAQQDHGGTAGWASSGVGILGGMERRWDAGLTLGLHLALAGRRTDVNGPHDARAETRGAYIGAQALYGPDGWGGFYLTGQVRLGLEDNEMSRDVAFNGYARHNESRWTGLAGGALLGAGKDRTWGDYSAGPLAWLEYGFVQRPELSETDGQASRLHVDGGVYDSLLLSVGGHLGRAWALPKNAGLAVDLLAAWRHELLDGTFRSGASFRGYGNEGFTSATDLVGRDALLVQGSLRLTRGNNFFAQADLGGEFRTAASSVNAGLSFGWEF